MARKSDHKFSQIPETRMARSVFDRSHGHKTTMDSGQLIPIFVDEVLPGDTISLRATLFGRLATPFVPVMDNLFLEVHFFFVPNRLVWDNWQKFMGEQEAPGSSTDFLVPQLAGTAWQVGSLGDYFGIPTGISNLSVNALPFRAYNLIWNEWYRDQNLQNPVEVNKDDGPDATGAFPLRRRKRHDYFTSCLPWPQKGPGVNLPLGDVAPVYGDGTPPYGPGSGGIPTFWTAGSGAGADADALRASQAGAVNAPVWFDNTGGAAAAMQWDDPHLVADLSEATAGTINSLRQAFQIQKLLERDARGGTRYIEILRSHFGVISPDARLQRPEFLGGGRVNITVNPVVQTSGSPPDFTGGYSTTPQGNLAAYGTLNGGAGFSKSFVEHGWVIGLASVRADLSYQQGLERKWSRRTRFDFYWPAFAHLGEQAVLNREIYAQGTAEDDGVFGYQERWAEYRYFPSIITGKFRSSDPQSLDVWHLAQDFAALPVLGAAFIEDNPPVDRVLAVTDEPQFLLDVWFRQKHVRPMPTYSVPGFIDHF